jgi:hypothetical protein
MDKPEVGTARQVCFELDVTVSRKRLSHRPEERNVSGWFPLLLGYPAWTESILKAARF